MHYSFLSTNQCRFVKSEHYKSFYHYEYQIFIFDNRKVKAQQSQKYQILIIFEILKFFVSILRISLFIRTHRLILVVGKLSVYKPTIMLNKSLQQLSRPDRFSSSNFYLSCVYERLLCTINTRTNIPSERFCCWVCCCHKNANTH